MQLDQLVFLLPCRAVEDLALDRGCDEAEQLLSAWSALYHPALVALADTVPHWAAAEEPPSEPATSLIVVPPCCEPYLPSDWIDHAESAGARLVRNERTRDGLVAAALKAAELQTPVDAELVADFLALGYCQFLIEMLTRQLRYMSNLDEVSFRSTTVAAARAAVAGDLPTAKRELQQAFSLLHQSREYYYPVESHLIDLTLIAPSTLGEPLRRELARAEPTSLLLGADVLAEMAVREPETLASLRAALEKGTASLVGGERTEQPLPLLPLEAAARSLDDGLALYQQHLGVRPLVFGRRRFGLSPLLPQVLASKGFTGALHSTLDDGRFPTVNQSRIQWEGLDGSTLEAIGKVPIDISQVDAFFRLPEWLGSSMDIDHVATVVFARWPGQSSPWYDSLRRIASYTTAVGTFETVDAYFKQTGMSGQCIIHKPDGYRSPYLRQAVDARQKDPISRWAAYYRTRALLDAARSMRLLELAAGAPGPDVDGETLARQIDAAVEHDAAHLDEIDETLTTAIDEARNRLTDVLCSSDGPKGYMVVNPCGFTRRVLVDVSGLARIPATAAPVVAAGETRKGKQAMVEVPAMGFAWVGAAEASEPAAATRRGWFFRRKQSDSPPLAAENILQNEFFHVVIDRTAGSIRAVLDGVSRGPRLAQQIALRWPEGDENDPGHESHYTIMAADDVRITSAGPVVGEITSRGRLMDRTGRRRGGFVQMTRVSRGSRIIEIDIELDVPDVPTGNPWQSYYAARFAWSDESSRLYRGLQGVGVKTDETMIDAPEFLELQTDKTRTAILPGGLPYHRRLGYRRLDTLLVVPGESQRRFRLAAGIDCPSAAMAAVDFLTPVPVIGANAPPATHGWLFHIEGKSAVATHWQPIIEDNRLRGAVVRLLETEGRSVRFGVRSPQPLASAVQRGMGDAAACELPVAGDRAEVELRGYGWSEIELRFV